MSTHPIPAIVREALNADSVLRQSREEMDALEEMARLAERWIEARVQGSSTACLVLDAQIEVQRRQFRRAEKKRRKAEKENS